MRRCKGERGRSGNGSEMTAFFLRTHWNSPVHRFPFVLPTTLMFHASFSLDVQVGKSADPLCFVQRDGGLKEERRGWLPAVSRSSNQTGKGTHLWDANGQEVGGGESCVVQTWGLRSLSSAGYGNWWAEKLIRLLHIRREGILSEQVSC